MTAPNPNPESKPTSKVNWLPWLLAALVIGALAALWVPVSKMGMDPAALRSWVEQAGPLGPLVFFLLNVAQIVVAPIPGYPVQVLGGILFGLVPGSIITVGGMVTGGVLAAWLGRKLGRPWLEKRMGADTLQHWSDVAHINSFWTWWIVLLIPVGDIPYFLAGLSRIRLRTFALAILTSRGPFTVLIVWLGDRVINLPLTWIALSMAVVAVVVIIGFSQAAQIEEWGRAFILRRVSAPKHPATDRDSANL
ncbi:MAG: TVP38/TMEM64 family protein [Chloroflexi bacterium]|nr:MAG: TVP38/TMEM64 family protein [Chloroflexota bacterium]